LKQFSDLTPQTVKEKLNTTAVYRRSYLLTELVQRLFENEILCQIELDRALVDAILKETLRIMLARNEKTIKPEADEEPLMDLAIRFIESNLFSSISAKQIAQAARSSIPTLYRHFKSELGMAPLDFQRYRRLDEAAEIIRTRKYNISDVAVLVGYEDLAAFSKAFKKKFKVSPKSFK
jgi:AraC-like DNA-binding protein